ncbi:avidin/streptavidin family protein [Zavarzinia compransoris]|uniref:avidin/streptavidin family protein n=1 Tax=Zavarzinia marina TaxID=2911065 RepID=UPI001F3E7033|nr:avidin/streptavidin family protein [Zavarzinia marina]MCF4167058.1 avidin/streptavidin family protein [Zavarzinia marina]
MQQEKALLRAATGAADAFDFSGQWINELGSIAFISQNVTMLAGTYQSAVSEGGGTTLGDLTGFASGNLIAFTVRWRDFQAITAWVGQLVPNAPQYTIKTLWQMTNQVTPGDEWASINAGADIFTRR